MIIFSGICFSELDSAENKSKFRIKDVRCAAKRDASTAYVEAGTVGVIVEFYFSVA